MNTINHDIDGLILQLNHASTPTDAIASISAIAATGIKEQSVAAALISALSHHHPSVGAAAVKLLVQLAPASVKPLIAAFHTSSDQGLQAHIIQALAQIGDPEAIEVLAELIGTSVANHCQGNVRRIAARGLGRIAQNSNNPENIRCTLDKLTWALSSPEDWGLRYAAVVSLAEIATPEALVALQHALTQETDKVVLHRITTALEALGVG
ncbi:MAG: HEAT repeat domain-containing protein [Tolypothrix carrinoi HA7290-LM1]|jgi:bilin biosynthesis PecF protein|nr:HEAT repeat domain-containing protein [Tolypothrix carrinoi HA7290-LM1]